MSELQEVEVTIRPDGTVRVRVQGAPGPQRLAITRKLEELLGGVVLERVHTDELRQADAHDDQDRATERSGSR